MATFSNTELIQQVQFIYTQICKLSFNEHRIDEVVLIIKLHIRENCQG